MTKRVANNPMATVEQLWRLYAKDPRAALLNPNCPLELFTKDPGYMPVCQESAAWPALMLAHPAEMGLFLLRGLCWQEVAAIGKLYEEMQNRKEYRRLVAFSVDIVSAWIPRWRADMPPFGTVHPGGQIYYHELTQRARKRALRWAATLKWGDHDNLITDLSTYAHDDPNLKYPFPLRAALYALALAGDGNHYSKPLPAYQLAMSPYGVAPWYVTKEASEKLHPAEAYSYFQWLHGRLKLYAARQVVWIEKAIRLHPNNLLDNPS